MRAIRPDHFSGGAHLAADARSDSQSLSALLMSIDAKASVRAASTANIADLTAASVSIDGVTLVEGDRVLLKDQSTGSQRGIYVVGVVTSGVAALTRSKDADVSAEVTSGLKVYVEEGTANAQRVFTCTTANPIVLGTTSLTFTASDINATDLASTASGKGASLVGVYDVAGLIAGTSVEAALAEMVKGQLTHLPGIHAVRGLATANVADLSAMSTTLDGLTLVAGDRVLLAGQSTGAERGIYVVGTVDAGAAPVTRAADWAAAASIPPGTLVAVAAGTAGANKLYQVTNATAVTVATTTPTFSHLPNAALLASTANGKGASLIGIEDAGNIITATDVEAALAEIKTLVDAGMVVGKRTVTVAHGDLTDGDTSQTINIGAVLPANARIVGVDLRELTDFSGGGTASLTVDVGTAGDIDALIDGADLFTGSAVDGGPSTIPQGIRPNKTMGAAQLIATFVCDGGHVLSDFTAGSVTIDVLYTVLA